jgi:hypothetical protein
LKYLERLREYKRSSKNSPKNKNENFILKFKNWTFDGLEKWREDFEKLNTWV